MLKNYQKVLLAEDDRSIARLYQTKLEMSGYTVEVASDGEECLAKIDTFKPNLILLDVIIPKIDGFEILKRLQQNSETKNIPVILLTNLGQDEDVEKGKKMGAVNYLVKSQFTPTEIVQKIEASIK